MNEIKVLLIDDEYLALNLLEEFLNRMTGFVVVGKAKTALQAMDILQQHSVDLMFLDIQMPILSGNQFLKSLRHPPVTIFTTAYSEYAVEAFDLNAADYLLKPFAFDRFIQAIQKAQEQLRLQNNPTLASKTPQNEELEVEKPEKEHLVIKVEGKILKLPFEEILFIEGLKEYVKIVCKTTHYVTFERIKNLEAELPPTQFMRVHKSYIVAKDQVKSIETNLLEIGKHFIPISRDKKEEVMKAIFGL